MNRYVITIIALAFSSPVFSLPEDGDGDQNHHSISSDLPVDVIPDLREEDTKLKFQSKKNKNWFAVPIPMSSPTFGTGLIVGGAYFYPQTEEQKKSQPASFTGVAAGYTHNESEFAGLMQQNYWAEDKWRFTGIAAYADFKLTLIPPPTENSETGVLDWLIKGGLFQTSISRRLGGRWYLGLSVRYLDITQKLDLSPVSTSFILESKIQSPGLGLKLEYDSRDMPSNAYTGSRFELKAIYADQSQQKGGSYKSYFANFISYHPLSDSLVVAWEVNGCKKFGEIPMWDTCRLNLRGFPLTEYLSKKSVYLQAEARWRFHRRWGLVAFAGGGRVEDSFGNNGESETIPSYGVGLRFMVLKSQRINVRVDYARSNNGNEAWYLGVSEAF